jgi:hypothetical protein
MDPKFKTPNVRSAQASRILHLQNRSSTVTPGPTGDSELPHSINKSAFRIHKVTGCEVKKATARKYRDRAVTKATKGLEVVINLSLTLDQQALALTVALQNEQPELAERMGLGG